jgi:hypothetical protein
MTKAFSYKLALIGGLSSTLLATAAFANTTGGLSINQINEDGEKIEGSHLPDRACGAKQSYARYLLVNEGSKPVTLTDLDININKGDDFHFNKFIVRKDRILPIFGTTCEEGTELARFGGSCEVVVDMTPLATLCLNTTDRGTIDRELVIEYSNSPRGDVSQNATLVEPINFEIDLEGGINKYAVLADRIYVRENNNTSPAIPSHLQVEQDVSSAEGFFGFYAYPQNIWFNDGFFKLFLDSYPAFYDARALEDRVEDLVGNTSHCNPLTITGITAVDPTDPNLQVITPGFYCLDGSQTAVDGYFVMEGDEDQLFVISLNKPSRNYLFGTNTPITVELRGGANPDNIIWLVPEKNATFNLNISTFTGGDPTKPATASVPGSVLPGVILSQGTINIRDAEVLGRVFAISERGVLCAFGCNPTHNSVNFYGNVAIEDPANATLVEEVVVAEEVSVIAQ